jgi:anti-sigma B factor antagonist
MSSFSVHIDHSSPETCRLVLAGDLDLAASPHLTDVVVQLITDTEAERVVLDLAGVGFIDSTGLGALIAAHNAAHERGREMTLANVGDQAAIVLRITALDRVFGLDEPAAAEQLDAEQPDAEAS